RSPAVHGEAVCRPPGPAGQPQGELRAMLHEPARRPSALHQGEQRGHGLQGAGTADGHGRGPQERHELRRHGLEGRLSQGPRRLRREGGQGVAQAAPRQRHLHGGAPDLPRRVPRRAEPGGELRTRELPRARLPVWGQRPRAASVHLLRARRAGVEPFGVSAVLESALHEGAEGVGRRPLFPAARLQQQRARRGRARSEGRREPERHQAAHARFLVLQAGEPHQKDDARRGRARLQLPRGQARGFRVRRVQEARNDRPPRRDGHREALGAARPRRRAGHGQEQLLACASVVEQRLRPLRGVLASADAELGGCEPRGARSALVRRREARGVLAEGACAVRLLTRVIPWPGVLTAPWG
ncbi:unnamed protein product, partial [Prorocentrum cordatum]